MNNLSSFIDAQVNTPPAIAGGIHTTLDAMQQLNQSYGYDPVGKRISKTVSGITTYFYSSEDGLVAEADNNGAVTTSYHWQMNTPWGTDPMFIRQGGVYGYYVTDHLGTPQRVVGRNGAVLWGAVYDAFGGADIVTASLVNNLRFPGQYYDAESGLHYNYWRYYEPGTGRYVSSDPIGLAGGVNFYGYVGGNPVGRIDPLGLFVLNPGSGALAGSAFGPVGMAVGALAGGLALAFAAQGIYEMAKGGFDEADQSQGTSEDYARERKAYSRICKTKDPSTGDPCTDAKNNLNRLRKCIVNARGIY